MVSKTCLSDFLPQKLRKSSHILNDKKLGKIELYIWKYETTTIGRKKIRPFFQAHRQLCSSIRLEVINFQS